MTYQQFIEALKPQLVEAQGLFGLRELHENPRFRKWRHQVTDLIERIKTQGYSVNSSITTRYFDNPGTYSYTPSDRDRLFAYERDLQDTINELQTIVEGYEKFGDPKAPSQGSKEQKRLEWPNKMTLAWLWHHAPVSVWWWLGGVLVTVFLLGIAIGQSTFYAQLQKPWNPERTTESTTPTSHSRGPSGTLRAPPAPELIVRPMAFGWSICGHHLGT